VLGILAGGMSMASIGGPTSSAGLGHFTRKVSRQIHLLMYLDELIYCLLSKADDFVTKMELLEEREGMDL
jgi:hypothetical protein